MDVMISAMRNRQHCELGLTNKRIIDLQCPMSWQPSLTRSNPPTKTLSARRKPFDQNKARQPLKNFNNFKFHMHEETFAERTMKDDLLALKEYSMNLRKLMPRSMMASE